MISRIRLLVVMSTNCSFCTESIPFYKRLIESQNGRDNPIRIVGLFPESQDIVDQYLRQHQLNIINVSSFDLAQWNIAGTPTLLLINNQGKIVNFWAGKLSKESEQEILKTVS